MSRAKDRIPAVEGWFDMDSREPHLLGSRCTRCQSYFFPKESFFCGNPACSGSEFEEVRLSRTGKLWSFTNNCYRPPAPYVSPDPFVPYAIAAVELSRERMVVLGQVAAGVDFGALKAGTEMELVLETLYEDDAAQHVVWKWKPTAG
jgi:uncharacterized OB-fold protein